jgi:hypothetical protein
MDHSPSLKNKCEEFKFQKYWALHFSWILKVVHLPHFNISKTEICFTTDGMSQFFGVFFLVSHKTMCASMDDVVDSMKYSNKYSTSSG